MVKPIETKEPRKEEGQSCVIYHRYAKYRKKDGSESKFIRQLAIKQKDEFGDVKAFENDFFAIPQDMTAKDLEAMAKIIEPSKVQAQK